MNADPGAAADETRLPRFSRRATLLASTRMLMGLRFQQHEIKEILGRIEMSVLGIRGIEESVTYQEIFLKGEAKGEARGKVEGKVEGKAEGKAEGRAEEARELLLRLGGKKLGNPDSRILREISTLNDLNHLHDLLDRVDDVTSWEVLLDPEVSRQNAEHSDDSARSL